MIFILGFMIGSISRRMILCIFVASSIFLFFCCLLLLFTGSSAGVVTATTVLGSDLNILLILCTEAHQAFDDTVLLLNLRYYQPC